MRRIFTITLALAVALTMAVAQDKGKGGGKGGGKGKGGFTLPPKIMLTIEGFADGGMIPAKYTAAVSPKISWTQVPPGTQAFVLLMHDPDPVLGGNPDPDVTHWLLYNIPGTSTGLPEGVPAGPTLPDGTVQATGLTGQPAYFGPGPPAGHGIHHYTFELWALNAKIDVPTGDIATVRAAVMNAMKGKVIGKGFYMGLYENK